LTFSEALSLFCLSTYEIVRNFLEVSNEILVSIKKFLIDWTLIQTDMALSGFSEVFD